MATCDDAFVPKPRAAVVATAMNVRIQHMPTSLSETVHGLLLLDYFTEMHM